MVLTFIIFFVISAWLATYLHLVREKHQIVGRIQRRLEGGRDKEKRKWEIAEICQSHGMDATSTLPWLNIVFTLSCKEGLILQSPFHWALNFCPWVLVHSASFSYFFCLDYWPADLCFQLHIDLRMFLGTAGLTFSSSQINFSSCISCLINGSANFPSVFLHLLFPLPFQPSVIFMNFQNYLSRKLLYLWGLTFSRYQVTSPPLVFFYISMFKEEVKGAIDNCYFLPQAEKVTSFHCTFYFLFLLFLLSNVMHFSPSVTLKWSLFCGS